MHVLLLAFGRYASFWPRSLRELVLYDAITFHYFVLCVMLPGTALSQTSVIVNAADSKSESSCFQDGQRVLAAPFSRALQAHECAFYLDCER